MHHFIPRVCPYALKRSLFIRHLQSENVFFYVWNYYFVEASEKCGDFLVILVNKIKIPIKYLCI